MIPWRVEVSSSVITALIFASVFSGRYEALSRDICSGAVFFPRPASIFRLLYRMPREEHSLGGRLRID